MIRVLGDFEMELASLGDTLISIGCADLAEWVREERKNGIDGGFGAEGGDGQRQNAWGRRTTK